MKYWYRKPCRNFRRDIFLLAAGVLRAPESDPLKAHLAGCADCRKKLAEIEAVTASLSNWEKEFADILPGRAVRSRWAEAVQATNRRTGYGPAASVHRHTLAPAIREWCHDVLWPYRRVWAGVAAAWVLILLGSFSLQDHHPSALARKSRPPTPEQVMAFRDQQVILAELLANHAVPAEAERPKFLPAQPRTARMMLLNA